MTALNENLKRDKKFKKFIKNKQKEKEQLEQLEASKPFPLHLVWLPLRSYLTKWDYYQTEAGAEQGHRGWVRAEREEGEWDQVGLWEAQGEGQGPGAAAATRKVLRFVQQGKRQFKDSWLTIYRTTIWANT